MLQMMTCTLGEYINNSPDGQSVLPCFGELFLNEPIPTDGKLDVSDAPGFGLELNPEAGLKLFRVEGMS
jgi:L-rhamnonate dehydratase